MISLPVGFVYLQDIDPTLIESVRYAGNENFIGKRIEGYKCARIILSKVAAQCVRRAHHNLKQEGFSLVVYDGYRPQKAVNAFIEWSQDESQTSMKPLYYPTIDKAELFAKGYLAKKSSHSRGSTIDLSIIPLGDSVKPLDISYKTLSNGDIIPITDDGTVDMGASFDLFHDISHHDSPLIDQTATFNRNILRKAMKAQGFSEYRGEWWH